ncbi:FK506-binding protein 15 isoform X2 [Lampetra fluviatilis]
MFGGGDEDDGDFITAPSGSNLASLFGGVDASGQGNPFQFHAPKQPRKGQPSAAKSQKPAPDVPAVMSTAVVQTYMYVNGQYASRGKLGLALLGSPEAKDYKLLLYGQQRKTVTSARIHSSFAFSVQANNYASFYDDQRQNWSIMFDNEQVASDFSTQVCLAKWQATPREELGKALIQDLRLGEGQGVEAGDNLEVEYTGWILEPSGALGEVFDSNVGKEKMMRLKLGKGKVIKGWEQGMLGMGKGGRRLLLVPAPLGYGAQGLPPRIPANSSLAFRVEIKRVRFARDAGATDLRDCHSPSPAPSLVEAPPTLTAPQTPPPPPGSDESVKSRSHSLTEQLTSQPDSVRAKLISRMARMGQPLLPMGGGATPAQGDTSDSEHEDGGLAVGTPGGAVRTPSPQPRAVPTSTPTTAAPVPGKQPVPAFRTLAQPPTAQQQQHHQYQQQQQHHQQHNHNHHPQQQQQALAPYQVWPDAGFMYSQVPAAAAPSPAYSSPFPGDVTSFLMTEARQHNTEVRLAIGKVSDKMEQLQSKVDDIHRQSVGGLGLPQAAMATINLDAAMIMQSIMRILQENERLKQEVLERNSKIEQQNEKIGDLLQRNQRYVEQSNLLLEQRNDSFKNTTEQNQGRVLTLEQDKVSVAQARLTEALAQVTAQLTGAQGQLAASRSQQQEADGRLQGAQEEAAARGAAVVELGEQLSAVRDELRHSQEALRCERAQLHETRLGMQTLQQEVGELRADKAAVEKASLERERRRAADDERRCEELRLAHDAQLLALREQLQRGPQTQQLSALRAELEEQHTASLQKLQAERDALRAERDALRRERDDLLEKVARLQTERDELSERSAESENQEARLWQEKYTGLRLKAAEMRREFEARLALTAEARQQQEAGSTDTLAEVKKVMNGVFRSLRSEFTLEGTYSGRMILATVMNTIKATTLSLVSGSESPDDRRVSDSSSSAAAAVPASEPETSDTAPDRPPAQPQGPGVGGANASGDVANGASRPREDAAPLSVATTSVVEELEEVKEVVEVEVEVEAPPPPGDGASEPTAGAAEGRDLGDGSAEAAATAGVEGKAAERECDTTTVTTATAAVVVVAVTVAVEEDTAVAGNGVPERPTSVAGIPQQPPSSAGDDEDDDEEQEDGNLFSYEAPDKKVSRDDSGSPVDKPGPPPLFGDDEEDDDDVDWLK